MVPKRNSGVTVRCWVTVGFGLRVTARSTLSQKAVSDRPDDSRVDQSRSVERIARFGRIATTPLVDDTLFPPPLTSKALVNSLCALERVLRGSVKVTTTI